MKKTILLCALLLSITCSFAQKKTDSLKVHKPKEMLDTLYLDSAKNYVLSGNVIPAAQLKSARWVLSEAQV